MYMQIEITRNFYYIIFGKANDIIFNSRLWLVKGSQMPQDPLDDPHYTLISFN